MARPEARPVVSAESQQTLLWGALVRWLTSERDEARDELAKTGTPIERSEYLRGRLALAEEFLAAPTPQEVLPPTEDYGVGTRLVDD